MIDHLRAVAVMLLLAGITALAIAFPDHAAITTMSVLGLAFLGLIYLLILYGIRGN